MAKLYTMAKIIDLATAAGFLPVEARIAAAIAMCESPAVVEGFTYGDQDRVGDQDLQTDVWGPSMGLWQVRSLKAAQPGDLRYGPSLSADASYNARSAFAIYTQPNRRGFGEWTTYRNEAYKAYLQDLFPPKPGTYLVVAGDTFIGIDRKLGLPEGTMQSLHPDQDPRRLQIGQSLQVPFFDQIVQPGDTLMALMRKCGYQDPIDSITLSKVATYANLLDPSRIYPGQNLRILKPGVISTNSV